ncbi:hypothetical protein BVK86_04440 [Pseudomonas reinekei]|uniref:Uncharacterized protein n=1 Tax=Pseudomonas reinekei TaxID=395598 RepID=A0A1Q9X399_PSERE|nr:hypothetical protein BVK86_04440 [Pseudomonas reinekei]
MLKDTASRGGSQSLHEQINSGDRQQHQQLPARGRAQGITGGLQVMKIVGAQHNEVATQSRAILSFAKA